MLIIVVMLLHLYVTCSDTKSVVSIEENGSRVKTILAASIETDIDNL